MKPPPLPTKKMALGVDPDIMQTLAAVKEVAHESNIPTVVHPKSAPRAPAVMPVAEPVAPEAAANVDQLVHTERRPSRLGGHRIYFRCPVCSRSGRAARSLQCRECGSTT